jgi:hypothetical protein
MFVDEYLIDQKTARNAVLVEDQSLGLEAIPPKTDADQDEEARAEQEAAFPFEARFAEDAFDRLVGHITGHCIKRGGFPPDESSPGVDGKGNRGHNKNMEEKFDPYLHWLGIRDPQRPPNHYRLLGLEPFETDPEVILNAADRQMMHIRRFQGGRHSLESQQVLNELAAANLPARRRKEGQLRCLAASEADASAHRSAERRGRSAISRVHGFPFYDLSEDRFRQRSGFGRRFDPFDTASLVGIAWAFSRIAG